MYLLGVAIGLTSGMSGAQSAAYRDAHRDAQSVPDSSPFAALTRARAPNAYRGANGAPGPRYWQNRADYDLHATLDTAAGVVRGGMTLRYTNNSPDTLAVIWFQMEQNGFRGLDGKDKSDYGDHIERFVEIVNGKPVAVQLEDHGTVAKATLPRPLRPGQTATFQATWHFVVPPRPSAEMFETGMPYALMAFRMSRDGSLYNIAQWYPRVNVYDDAKGWNTEPYNGPGEFYLEYGDFTLAVTVPATYVVAATGMLENRDEVLTTTQRTRLAQAARSDTTIHVITADELANGTAHRRRTGMMTWKFRAKNVRDAVFATSPEYQWDASSWKGILTQAFYRPSVPPIWRTVAKMVRASVQEFSERWYPYPYPQISVADMVNNGPMVGGMEYPMLSFDNISGDSAVVYALITHESGHNWFPMIVGSNERVNDWMDEGFNSFIDNFSDARWTGKREQDIPINRPTEEVRALVTEGGDSYGQPTYLLHLLRQYVLGPVVFDKAFRTYIQRWAYKHPIPEDFFRSMNDVSGQNLDWFWNEWFYEVPGFDQAIDSVAQVADGNVHRVTVVYRNHARGVMPLPVRFTFRDGTTEDVIHPVDIWRAGSRYATSYTFKQPVTRIQIDPKGHLVDSDATNNVWTAP